MELRLLRYFVKVAECRNFSAASRELFVSQSTLSQQIAQLEDSVGHKLFIRNSHTLELTEAGTELLPYARKTLYAAEMCEDRMCDLDNMLSGTLSIGITYSFSGIMTESLLLFMRSHPGVKLNVCYDQVENLMDKLQHHQLDLVLAFKPARKFNTVESQQLFTIRLAAVVNKSHPLAKAECVTLGELAKYDLVLPSKGLQTRNRFEQVLQFADYPEMNIRAELNNVSTLLKIIKGSKYVSILSEGTVTGEPDLVAIPLKAEFATLEGCLHMRNDSYTKCATKEFIRIVSESLEVLRNKIID